MKKLLLAFAILAAAPMVYAQCSNCTMPFRAASQGVGSSSAVTIPLPAGVAANDVLIAAVHSGWCSQGSSVTPPLGWILIAETSNTGPGCGSANTSVQLSTFYKVATANEPAAYIFTGNTSQQYVGSIVAYSGVDTLNPINTNSNFGAQDSCGSIVAQSVTTTACTRLVGVFFCSVNFSGTNIIPDAQLTERVDVGTTGNNPWGNENLEISDKLMTTIGASGNFTASLSNCNSDGWVTGAQLIALECNFTTSVSQNLSAATFSLTPNPTEGVFQISLSQPEAGSYQITNSLGQIVRSAQFNRQISQIDLSGEAAGLYFIQVMTQQGITTKKLLLR
jgi:Secretion system C-terminal sorting domain